MLRGLSRKGSGRAASASPEGHPTIAAPLSTALEGVLAKRPYGSRLPKGATPSSDSAYYIGNIALFGHGIRDEHQHEGAEPAKFSFKIDRPIQNALGRDESGKMNLTFVARGAVIKGAKEAVRSNATVTVGKARSASRRLKKT